MLWNWGSEVALLNLSLLNDYREDCDMGSETHGWGKEWEEDGS